MDASRRHETLGSEIKDFTIHSKSSNQSVSKTFELVLQGGNTGGPRCIPVHVVGCVRRGILMSGIDCSYNEQ